MVHPAPSRVARRAVILYMLMMRFTFETNPNHPRSKEWTEFLGIISFACLQPDGLWASASASGETTKKKEMKCKLTGAAEP